MFYRANETDIQYEKRLQDNRERYTNLPNDKKEKRLEDMKQYSQQSRAAESTLRRSTRLEADRANKRIQQAAKSAKGREKDAHEKWKQRYKK